MSLIRAIVTSCIFFICINVLSQKILFIPEEFVRPGQHLDLNRISSGKYVDGVFWRVYSDRNYNRTSTQPGSKQTYKNIQLYEMFYVTEENGKYIHIYKDPQMDFSGFLSSGAEDYGWIARENMLLWDHCMINDDGLEQKTLFFESEVNKQIFKNDLLVNEGFNEPYRIFYVFKYNSSSVLLGRGTFLNIESDPSQFFLGWFLKSDIILWNNGLALEPSGMRENHGEDFITRKPSIVFSSKGKAKKYQKGRSADPNGILWRSDAYMTSNDPGPWLRFPVLGQKDGIVSTIHYDLKQPGNSSILPGIAGYAPTHSGKPDEQVFEYVIMLKKNELATLILNLDKLQASLKGADKRLQFRNTIENMISDKMPLKNQAEIGLMTFHEFYEKAFLCQSQSVFAEIAGIQINQTENPELISDGILNKLAERLDECKDEINRSIFNNDEYKYSFRLYNDTYYWIPITLLP